MGEGFCKLVLAESCTLFDGGNSHESVDKVVRSDLTLLSIEETVDVTFAEGEECEEEEKAEKVHSPTLGFAVCRRLAQSTTLSVLVQTTIDSKAFSQDISL